MTSAIRSAPEKLAYLTVDDAPVADLGPKLDLLDRLGITALFFCTGAGITAFPDVAREAIERGHILGNHSFDHPRFSQISIAEARDQIERTDRLIDEAYVAASVPRSLRAFRFPFLNNGSDREYRETDWNDPHVAAIQEILREHGYELPAFQGITYAWWHDAGFSACLNTDCTFDTFDWVLPDERFRMFGYHDLPTVLGRIDEHEPQHGRGLNDRASNEIVMMHAFTDVAAFEAIVTAIIRKGIRFVAPAEGAAATGATIVRTRQKEEL